MNKKQKSENYNNIEDILNTYHDVCISCTCGNIFNIKMCSKVDKININVCASCSSILIALRGDRKEALLSMRGKRVSAFLKRYEKNKKE